MDKIIYMGKNYHITVGSLLAFIIVFVIPVTIIVIGCIIANKRRKKNNKQIISSPGELNKGTLLNLKGYYKPKKLLTTTEILFYHKLIEATKFKNVEVLPQINLASVIEKKSKYRNELFRNIDFGIFDENYNVIVLIELNDKTHFTNQRMKRDSNVREICKRTGIPVKTFWTTNNNTVQSIADELNKYIEKAA